MQELAELGRTVGEGVQGLETIDHDEPGAVLLQDCCYALNNSRETVTADRRSEVFVEDRPADRCLAEETQVLAKRTIFSSGSETVEK